MFLNEILNKKNRHPFTFRFQANQASISKSRKCPLQENIKENAFRSFKKEKKPNNKKKTPYLPFSRVSRGHFEAMSSPRLFLTRKEAKRKLIHVFDEEKKKNA